MAYPTDYYSTNSTSAYVPHTTTPQVETTPVNHLYCVFVVDKTVKADEKAVNTFYVRAHDSEQAKLKAALRAEIEEEYLGDYDIIPVHAGVVSQVAEDAE